MHGRHLQGKSGGGDYWAIKILGATYCKHRRLEATLGGVSRHASPPPPPPTPFIMKNEGHCGSDFYFLSSYVYCTCSEYLNMGRE